MKIYLTNLDEIFGVDLICRAVCGNITREEAEELDSRKFRVRKLPSIRYHR